MTPGAITEELMRRKIKSPGGKDTWYQNTVISILTNEKYKGDALLQKYYTKDYLTHKQMKNNGEVPQYYVEGHHEAIIAPEIFDTVQEEMKKRRGMNERYCSTSIFSTKIKCGDCGGWFGPKLWHSNSKYRKIIFRCNSKYRQESKCTTPHLSEQQLKEVFISAFNKLMKNKKEILANMEVIMEALCNTSEMEQKAQELSIATEAIDKKMKDLIDRNAHTAQNQEEYQEQYDNLALQYDEKLAEWNEQVRQIEERKVQKEKISGFTACIARQDGVISEFDCNLWTVLVDYVTVYNKEDIRVTFKDGTEIRGNR